MNRILRLELALHLLTTTDWPLDRIAESTAYTEGTNLSAAFKKRFGLSPSHYCHQQEDHDHTN